VALILKKRWNIYRDRIPEIKCIKKNAGGGISIPTPCILGKSDENSRKIVADKAVYTIDKNKELG
jgi:hypothetical protein